MMAEESTSRYGISLVMISHSTTPNDLQVRQFSWSHAVVVFVILFVCLFVLQILNEQIHVLYKTSFRTTADVDVVLAAVSVMIVVLLFCEGP